MSRVGVEIVEGVSRRSPNRRARSMTSSSGSSARSALPTAVRVRRVAPTRRNVHAERPRPLDGGQVDDLEPVQRGEVRRVRRALDQPLQMRAGLEDQRTAARVGLPDLEGPQADLEASARRLLLDESRGLERPEQPQRDRLLQACLGLNLDEAQRPRLGSEGLQHVERTLDRLHALGATTLRITVCRSDSRTTVTTTVCRVNPLPLGQRLPSYGAST